MSVADAGIQGVRLYAAYENAIWFAITISITKIKLEMILNLNVNLLLFTVGEPICEESEILLRFEQVSHKI